MEPRETDEKLAELHRRTAGWIQSPLPEPDFPTLNEVVFSPPVAVAANDPLKAIEQQLRERLDVFLAGQRIEAEAALNLWLAEAHAQLKR